MKKLSFLFTVFLFSFITKAVFSQRYFPDSISKSNKQTQENQRDAATNQFMGLRFYLPWGETVFNMDGEAKTIWSKKLRFRIIDEIGDTTFIKFRTISEDPLTMRYVELNPKADKSKADFSVQGKKKLQQTKYYNVNPVYNDYVNTTNSDEMYYLLKGAKRTFTYHYRALTAGTLILPIKIRFAKDSVPLQASTDVAIGPYFGYQTGVKAYSSQKEQKLSHTYALFAAPGIISINPANSLDTTNTNSTLFGLTFGGGYLLELNSFQIGAFLGYDFTFGDDAKDWIYQPFKNNKAPWISVAIGFKFRKEE